MKLADLNCNFECDWLIELSDNKPSDNNLASKLVENRTFFKQSDDGKCDAWKQMNFILSWNTENQPSWLAFFKLHRTWSFHVVAIQGTVAKCTKIYNARAVPIILKPFVWRHSRWRCRRGLLSYLKYYEIFNRARLVLIKISNLTGR